MSPSATSDSVPRGEKPTVCFLGPFASFSHQATKQVFAEEEFQLTPTTTIESIFDVVQNGGADLGIVPFENSTHGLVTPALQSLADRQNRFTLTICGEIFLSVHHNLIGRQPPPPAAGGAAAGHFRHIKRIYSHPQAFGQTALFRSAHVPGVETIDVDSTSKAATLAAQDPTGESAAISSVLAAEMHGLDVLAASIEDRDDNTTRFLVIRKTVRDDVVHVHPDADKLKRARATAAAAMTDDVDSTHSGGGAVQPPPRRPSYTSMVSFTVPHHESCDLADALDVFWKNQLRLVSVNSLPSWIQPFQYTFLVEFKGSKLHDTTGAVKTALEQLDAVTHQWRWLGSWENKWN